MSDFNIDENTINQLKNMMNKGDLSDVISKLPPDVIQNFSSVLSSQEKKENTNSDNSNGINLDMNTILKLQSIMNKMNDTNDPRSNLLNSLKPYVREQRKEKIDQYANLMNITKIAELLNLNNSTPRADSKENDSNV